MAILGGERCAGVAHFIMLAAIIWREYELQIDCKKQTIKN